MAAAGSSYDRDISHVTSASHRQETLEIDDETNDSRRRRLNSNPNRPEVHPTSGSPESGIVLDSGSTNMTVQSENTTVSHRREETDGLETERYVTPNEMFSFDLTNPDEVLDMLEAVDLTEEDTEVLLSEAYSVNKKLKEILRKQESGGTIDSKTLSSTEAVVMVPGQRVQSATKRPNGSGAQRGGSNQRASRGSSGQQRGSSGQSALRGGDDAELFSNKQPLPPIKDTLSVETDKGLPSSMQVYSAKLRRPPPPSAGDRPTRNALSSHGPANHRHIPRQGLMPNKNSSIVKKKGKAPVPIGERPQWNDRFSLE